ncbi:hypothetical protein [Actinomadura montaniterrae]|uniref:Lipoprotein n=1 Tax=Actinomadura montaniterrae TaxID=1803903 RepID=A0A6L3VES8_9ACTN|nr:hypothetical protein [Actinomadura montaniterrae]KAB2359059.1 hypothetical protein F9B16_47250 [Actinomadura montaniterrae]
MRLRTQGALAALPLVMALALTGCGSKDGGDGGVASAGGGKQAAASKSADPKEMGVKYAQCMREHGVPMDDPQGGRVTLKLDGKTPKEKVDKAQEACRQYNPMENGAAKADPKMQEKVREFSECMRKNGVEDFPDPKPGQQGIMMDKKLSEDPDFNNAQQKCKDVMGGGPK